MTRALRSPSLFAALGMAILIAAPVAGQEDPSLPSGSQVIGLIRGSKETPAQTAEARSMAPKAQDVLARGEYLVNILGCNDCHTPMKNGPNGPGPDMSRMLSGHPRDLEVPFPDPMPAHPWIGATSVTNTAFAGPWGITFASNLTPDENTGMGIWTEKMFINAIRTGKHMGISRPIMPPMPWTAYSHLTDEDISALFAFLRTIPAIHNQVPEYQPPAEQPESFEE